jgi:hypothetical protein
MKSIKEFKSLLNTGISDEFNGNTLLGMTLNGLLGEKNITPAHIHNFEEKVDVICQMNKNGIDCFKDSYKLGSVSKAFYQVKLSDYTDFQ